MGRPVDDKRKGMSEQERYLLLVLLPATYCLLPTKACGAVFLPATTFSTYFLLANLLLVFLTARLATYYLAGLSTCYLLLNTCHSLLATSCLLLAAWCLLLTTHSSLPATRYLLVIRISTPRLTTLSLILCTLFTGALPPANLP